MKFIHLIKTFTLLNFFLAMIFPKKLMARDYLSYHNEINRAEEYIFIKNKIDSGLILYEKIFQEFDFVYVGDCVTAIQIALYKNDEKAFLSFTKKAFQNGLMLRNFKKIHYVKNNNLFLKDTLQFEKLYRNNRNHYLKRIDTNVLKEMYNLFAKDQLNKNKLENKNETNNEFKNRYFPVLNEISKHIKEIIFKKGIPLDRIIGI